MVVASASLAEAVIPTAVPMVAFSATSLVVPSVSVTAPMTQEGSGNGSAGGALETGRFLHFDGELPHNNLLLSLVQLMGGNDESFGRPEWCTGPLTGMV